MRRLSILDVAHGAQPIYSEDAAVTTVFNGEIYNYRDLQALARGAGHTFQTDSDTETIVHLYEMHGVDVVDYLRGMFGFALWDNKTQTLLLARDRAGKKPLYYYESEGRLWFASELKSLIAAGIPRVIDPVAVDLYLTYQYVPHPWSIFKGVKKLPPGHRLVWHGGTSKVERYWRLQYHTSNPQSRQIAATDELEERFRSLLLESTRMRLVSERPLGAFLSGGLDSSAVVAAMARTSEQTLNTFSIGFRAEAYNELAYARRVAELYGTKHHELMVEPDVEDLLPRLAAAFDEPYADSSAVPSFYLAEMSAKKVVVALNGDGGDESFGGYGRYANFLTSRLRHRAPSGVAAISRRLAARVARRELQSRFSRRLSAAALMAFETSDPRVYGRMVSYFRPEEKTGLYKPEFVEELAGFDAYGVLEELWDECSGTDPVNRVLAMDVGTYLPGDLLPKVDITTMMVSLEARSPLLDQELMAWAAALPGTLKVRDGTTKYLMKKALAPWLPQELIHRKKMGFGIPRNEWLQGPLLPMVNDLLCASDTRIADYLEPATVGRLIDKHTEFGGDGNRVWALLMLELWHREVLEAKPTDGLI